MTYRLNAPPKDLAERVSGGILARHVPGPPAHVCTPPGFLAMVRYGIHERDFWECPMCKRDHRAKRIGWTWFDPDTAFPAALSATFWTIVTAGLFIPGLILLTLWANRLRWEGK